MKRVTLALGIAFALLLHGFAATVQAADPCAGSSWQVDQVRTDPWKYNYGVNSSTGTFGQILGGNCTAAPPNPDQIWRERGCVTLRPGEPPHCR
jgi:hypothetical protein